MKYTKRQFENKLNEDYWLNLYSSMRSIETKKPFMKIDRSVGATIDKILLAINNLYKPYVVITVEQRLINVQP
jgi:hypothetical protein